MNPIQWIRWKLLVALTVIFGGLYFVGINPLARGQINQLGSLHSTARWSVEQVTLGLLGGDFEFADFLLATAEAVDKAAGNASQKGGAAPDPESKDQVMSAASMRFDLSMDRLLRKRFVVDEISIDTPRIRVEKRPDGSTNLGDFGGKAPEDADEPKPGDMPKGSTSEAETEEEEKDWVESTREWYETLQNLKEKLPGSGDDGTDAEGAQAAENQPDPYRGRAMYVYGEHPIVVINKIVARSLEVEFDSTSGETLPTLKNATLTLTGLSDRPSRHTEPIRLELEGQLESASIKLIAVVDLTKKIADYDLEFDAGDLPAKIIEQFIGNSLPVKITSGTLTVMAKVHLDGAENLLVEPKLSFRGVRLGTKGSRKVAGLEGAQFVSAFNQASELLGDQPLEIADLKITGTFSSPKFEWGDSVKNLVLNGGRAFAQAQLRRLENKAQEYVDEGQRRLDKERKKLEAKIAAKQSKFEKKAEEERIKVEKKIADDLQKELDKSGLGASLKKKGLGASLKKKGLGGLIPGTSPKTESKTDSKTDENKTNASPQKKAEDEALDRLKKGIFGGSGN